MEKHWKRIVYLLAAIQVGAGITVIGVMAFIPLFLGQLGLKDSGEAAMWSGWITGITPLMLAFSAPYWSAKAEQSGPKLVLCLVLIALSISAFAAGFAKSPTELFIIRMLQGLIGGFVPISLAIIVNICPERRIAWGMGVFQASMVFGLVFGPLLGGVTADWLGYHAPFMIFGVVSTLCLLGAMRYLPNIQFKNKEKRKESQWQLGKMFMHNPRVRLLVFMQFLCNFGITGIGPILPLYIKENMNIDMSFVATAVGLIIFAAGICSAGASLSVGRLARNFSMPRMLVFSSVGVGAFFILQWAMPNIWGLGTFRALAGFCMGFIMPVANTLITQSVEPERRNVVFGIVSSITIMGNVAGPIVSGAIAMYMGYAAVFWMTALAFFLSAYVIYYFFRKEIDEDSVKNSVA